MCVRMFVCVGVYAIDLQAVHRTFFGERLCGSNIKVDLHEQVHYTCNDVEEQRSYNSTLRNFNTASSSVTLLIDEEIWKTKGTYILTTRRQCICDENMPLSFSVYVL